MSRTSKSVLRRKKIHQGIRRTVVGTPQKPRLSVFRSNKEIYAQLIDDTAGHTIVSVNSRQKDLANTQGGKTEVASVVGKYLAEKAVALGINFCVFDRSGYLYHGRVKSLAEGAREGGLTF